MKMKILGILMMFLLLVSCSKSNPGESILVGGASSLTGALEEIAVLYEEETGVKVELQLASSGALKEQIINGAPIDVFISASNKEMEVLASKDLISNVEELLSNSLVLVTRKDSNLNSLDDLEKATYIALGNPESVPVGIYAKGALIELGLYDSLENKFVIAKDANQVVSWVATGNAEAGFSFYSDTVGRDDLKVLETLKTEPIIYPVGIVKKSEKAQLSKAFIQYLKGVKAQEIFLKHGFKVEKETKENE